MLQSIYDNLVQIHQSNPHLIKAMLAGTLVSTVCGVVGCFIILRRMAFLADAVAHSMLAGVVAGYLLMKLVINRDAYAPAMIIGSLFAGLLTVAMIGFVSKVSRIKEDTVIGIMYTAIFALGGVLLSMFSKYVHIDLVHFLTGQIVAVQNSDLWMMAFISAGVLAVVILLFRPLQLISFDRVMAASIGVPVLALDYLLTTCTSLVVVGGVNVVGIILVVGLLIIPAATAYLLCDRLRIMLVVAAFFGWSSFMLGYLFAELANVAPGSAVVVASAAQFLTVFLVAPRYGLLADFLRRRGMVPQPVLEDVLGCILRAPEPNVELATIGQHVDARPEVVQRAVRALERQELVERHGSGLALTASGRQSARRLLRAHRLWETYLRELGTPVDELHRRAHELEHVHDEQTVDYLDDKLGHPLTDPHGSEIPEDFVHLVSGAEVNASLLREGHRATVTAVAELAAHTPLKAGMLITAGPRQDDGRLWTLMLHDGTSLAIDHKTADAVTVRLDQDQ